MKKNKILLSVLFFTSTFAYSQEGRVGINTVSPAATLDVSASPTISTRIDGFIAPRLKGSELKSKDALYTSSQDGAIVYVTEALASGSTSTKTTNVTSIGYYYFDKTLNSGSGQWVKVRNGYDPQGTEPWYNQADGTQATANTQNIYQNGNVAVKKTTDFITGSDLDVKGSIRGGNAKIYSSGTTQVTVGSNSLAFGSSSEASGEGTIAIGPNSIATKRNSFALGNGAKTGYTSSTTTSTTGDHSYAIGEGAITGGNNAYALGKNVIATGTNSFAGGNGSLASGEASFAFGYVGTNNIAVASGKGAVAFARSTAGALESFAIGDGNVIESGANQSFTFGQGNKIYGANNNKYMNGAFGRYNEINGVVDYAFGTSNTISHTDVGVVTEHGGSLAVGLSNTINSNNASVALGRGNTIPATAVRAAAIGESNTASARASIALGYGNTSSGYASTAVGFQNIASSQGAFAGGFQSDATNDNAFAYGNDAQASGTNSIALGLLTKARGNESVAIGHLAETASTATTAMALGYNVKANGASSVAFGNGSVAIGEASIAMGLNGTTTTATASGAFAGGNASTASNTNAFAFGNQAQASGENSMAVGLTTKAQGNYSFTQGYGTNATNTSEAALGQYNLPVASAIFQVGDGNTSSSQSNLISAIKGGVPTDSWMAIGSGTASPARENNEKLRVYGRINATSYSVGATVLTVPDYVFQKYYTGSSALKNSYNFTANLYDVEKFLKEQHHLPGVTSAFEIKKAGFYNMEDLQMQNLEKTEELYLYTIEQQKQIDELKDIVKHQQRQIDELLKKNNQ